MTATALLVFARAAGFVSRAPGFSHPSVPHVVRAGIAMVLTIVLAPLVPPSHAVSDAQLVIALAIETAIGAAIGTAASLLYDGAYYGGRALDDYAGIRGSVPNAQIAAASGFGRIWSSVFLAGFFLLGGYRLVIEAFARSFDRLAPGALPSARGVFDYALTLPSTILEAALLVAGPAAAFIFCAQFALGAIGRVLPRFGAFALSFAIVFGIAVAVTALTLPGALGVSATPWIRVPFLSER